MKIYITRGDGIARLEPVESAVPKIETDQVLVKMTAASLNYRDLLVVNGIGSWKPAAPRIPLSDGAGEIVEVGANVSRWRIGDRVAGVFLPKWIDGDLTNEKYMSPLGGATANGVLAEYVAFDERAIVKIPDNLSNREAATLPVAALTAWHAVARRSRIKSGETVLIYGTGGVALFALQLAHAFGAAPIVVSGSDEKFDKVVKLGAAQVINYKKSAGWEAEVLELTGGAGVAHVIETIGGENLNRSLNVVKLNGTISFIGLIAGLSAPINTYQFVTKNVSLHGIETGSRKMFEEMNIFIERQAVKPVIDRSYAVAETRHALEYLESGRHFGKVTLEF